jgi:hypothetical protein
MNKQRVVAFVAAAGTAIGALVAPAAAITPCPDGHVAVPAVTADERKHDHNGNGLFCRKPNGEGQLNGGPDDKMDDVILP